MKKKKYVIANWKMHFISSDIHKWCETIRAHFASSDLLQLIICPSFPYLSLLSSLLPHSISIGAQNLSTKNEGAYTGEVSASMIKDIGASYVLVGHSERRQYYLETDQQISEKYCLAEDYALTPILCIGETQEEKLAGNTKEVLLRQLFAILKTRKGKGPIIVAYEPVWAIGTGLVPTLDDILTIANFLKEKSGDTELEFIYGGSVNEQNSAIITGHSSVNGILVGGASLLPERFISIYQSIQEVSSC